MKTFWRVWEQPTMIAFLLLICLFLLHAATLVGQPVFWLSLASWGVMLSLLSLVAAGCHYFTPAVACVIVSNLD